MEFAFSPTLDELQQSMRGDRPNADALAWKNTKKKYGEIRSISGSLSARVERSGATP